ncbi:lipoprotein [Neokomagataea thailandica NBRC 106555]|nr:lipoprotein [Neokomagataea thailandica NBRC 106555]
MQDVQLPIIVRVKNLANGRAVRIRVNDRGPERSDRILAVTPRVAELLAMANDTPVQIIEDENATRALDDALGGPTLEVKAAPLSGVHAESLDGTGAVHDYGSSSGNDAKAVENVVADLPQQWTQEAPGPTGIYVELGRFQSQNAAQMVAQRCSGQLRYGAARDGLVWNVQLGSYTSQKAADVALDLTPNCGVEGARIVIK